eukprot:6486125-Amphidinium_carterae.1
MLQARLPVDVADVLVGRHRRAMCYLQAGDGEWALFALGCGDLQGDAVAPGKFSCVLDPCLERWVVHTTSPQDARFFHVWDPCYHVHIDTSFGMFADDVFRAGLAADADAAAAKLNMWDAGMEYEVSARIHLQQNADKKQVLFRQYGKGAPRHMQLFHSKIVAYEGSPEVMVKHLGYMHHVDGWLHGELCQRKKAARAGWASLARFWSDAK